MLIPSDHPVLPPADAVEDRELSTAISNLERARRDYVAARSEQYAAKTPEAREAADLAEQALRTARSHLAKARRNRGRNEARAVSAVLAEQRDAAIATIDRLDQQLAEIDASESIIAWLRADHVERYHAPTAARPVHGLLGPNGSAPNTSRVLGALRDRADGTGTPHRRSRNASPFAAA